MQSDERKVGVVRDVTLEGPLGGQKLYHIVLTDRRILLVLVQTAGDIPLMVVSVGMTRTRDVDIARTDPAALAAREDTIAIPHAAVTSLGLVKKWARHRLRIGYRTPEGKEKYLEGFLDPPWKLVGQASKRGVHPKVAIAEHMSLIREVFLRALPPDLAARTTWEL